MIVGKKLVITSVFILLTFLWGIVPCAAALQTQTFAQQTTSTKNSSSSMHKKLATNTTKQKKRTVKKTSTKKIKKTSSQKKIATKKNNKKTKKIKRKRTAARVIHPNTQPARLNYSASSSAFVNTIKERLIHFVHNTVETLNYSSYRLGGTRFDMTRGVYILDCSAYVDRILQNVYPNAYSSLMDHTGTDRPTSHDYYDFFTNLADDDPNHHWNKVEAVEQLQAGDILVFRNKNRFGSDINGHVMVVMDKPIEADDEDNIYFVRVADSAPSGHSKDTRPSRTSGIGIGTLLLKVDPQTYEPYAYAWRVGSRWQTNVNIAMGRPVDMS